MNEYRCDGILPSGRLCNKLLLKYDPIIDTFVGAGNDDQPLWGTKEYMKQVSENKMEVKCPKCKKLNILPFREILQNTHEHKGEKIARVNPF